MLWFVMLPSTALTTMARISSTPSASIKGLVATFVAFTAAVFAAPTLTATLDYGTFQGAYRRLIILAAG